MFSALGLEQIESTSITDPFTTFNVAYPIIAQTSFVMLTNIKYDNTDVFNIRPISIFS